MPSQFQSIFETIKQILPRKSSDASTSTPALDRPLSETETRMIDQTIKAEKTRWWQITATVIPAAMLVIGLLLTGFAELIGLWAVLGFLLVAASPVVYWLQRLERQTREMTEEIKKLRSLRR